MSCKCCAGPCRKKRVKRKGGTKKPKASKQPTISITLAPSQPSRMPQLAPTFQSSIQTPLLEQTRKSTTSTETQTAPSIPSGRQQLMTEFARLTPRPTRPAGRPPASERALASLRGLSVTEYRTALERGTIQEEDEE